MIYNLSSPEKIKGLDFLFEKENFLESSIEEIVLLLFFLLLLIMIIFSMK
jgi:hypothetical protein